MTSLSSIWLKRSHEMKYGCSFLLANAYMEQRQQVKKGDRSGVPGRLLVKWHVPVFGRVAPHCPHWGELSLLCHSVHFTALQCFLCFDALVFLPLSAVFVVLFPLLAGWGGTMSVVVVENIPKAFAVSEFTPIVITHPGWPPQCFSRLVHC